ncbi:MAG: pyrroline-5-carboxylate reductase [Elusimicrobiota bacterium]
MTMNIKVGFIGFGRMGSAMALGALESKVLKSTQLFAFDPNNSAKKIMKRLGVRFFPNVEDVIRNVDVLFLCVKPQSMNELLEEISGCVKKENPVVVSIAAGIPIKKFENKFGAQVAIFRVMPNTPALLRAGMSVMSRGKNTTSTQESWVRKILSGLGEVTSLPESLMDGVTAVSGSGPAYVFYLAEAMLMAAKKFKIPEKVAKMIVDQTIFGAGLMLKKNAQSAEELRKQVTSPGGTTEAAIRFFDETSVKSLIAQGLVRASRRSQELARLLEN